MLTRNKFRPSLRKAAVVLPVKIRSHVRPKHKRKHQDVPTCEISISAFRARASVRAHAHASVRATVRAHASVRACASVRARARAHASVRATVRARNFNFNFIAFVT